MRPMNIMTKLSLAAALVACEPATTNQDLGSSASEARTTVNRVTLNGTMVDGGSWTEFEGVWISAYEIKNAGRSTVTVQYGRHWVDPSSWLCTTETWEWCEYPDDPSTCITETWENCRYTRGGYQSAWAEGLPSDALSWKGTLQATLNASLDAASVGYADSCAWEENVSWDCTSGAPTGSVNATFEANAQGSGTQSGGYSRKMGKYSIQQRGTWRYTSADFSGSLNGVSIAGQGYIGTGNNVTIERSPVTP